MPEIPAAPRRTRVRLTAEERRESILNAATEVFAEAGYRSGKTSDVAAQIGVSEPVVFQHFGSKAALFAAVLDRVSDLIVAEFGAVGGPASDLLAEFLSPAHLERLHARGSLGVLFADAAALTSEPGVAAAARRALATVADMFADLLRRGQADGGIRPDLDPRTGAWLLISMLSARALRAAVTDDEDTLEADLATLTLRTLTS